MVNPVTARLLFHQLKSNIVRGYMPVTEEDSILFAAIQLRHQLGSDQRLASQFFLYASTLQ
jgi:hypothetical protein